MGKVLTITLPDDAFDYLGRRAAAEQRNPARIIEDMLREQQAMEEGQVTVLLAVDPAGATLVRDEEESEAEFAARDAAFRGLVGLP
jgi:predicted transcriptional regulator